MHTPSLLVLLAAAVLTILAAAPATAQSDRDWRRYYPLEVGDTWEYHKLDARCPGTGPCDYYESFERRTVVGEVLLDGVPYAEVRFSNINEVTGGDYCVTTVAVRLNGETEAIETELLTGTCGYYAPERGTTPDTYDTPYAAGVNIGGISYDLMVREGEWAPGIWEVGATLAQDVGLLGVEEFSDVGPGNSTRSYRLRYAEVGGVVYGQHVVANEDAAAPVAFALGAPFPNPFRTTATLTVSLPSPEAVTLSVFDVLGRRVLSRDLGVQPTGESRHMLDGAGLPAGVYFVRATTASGVQATRRLVRVK